MKDNTNEMEMTPLTDNDVDGVVGGISNGLNLNLSGLTPLGFLGFTITCPKSIKGCGNTFSSLKLLPGNLCPFCKKDLTSVVNAQAI